MSEIQHVQHQPVSVQCRFTMTELDSNSSREFCVFDFPGCEGCVNAMQFIKTIASSEDPMKSMALSGWIAGALPLQIRFARDQAGPLMEKFIHQQNLALFKKRLAEPHTDAEREMLKKLLTEEQAKEAPPRQ